MGLWNLDPSLNLLDSKNTPLTSRKPATKPVWSRLSSLAFRPGSVFQPLLFLLRSSPAYLIEKWLQCLLSMVDICWLIDPWGIWVKSYISNFQTYFTDWQISYMLWNFPQMDATGTYWWQVNIGSCNGLVPWGNKPLPEPMLTQICCHMASQGHNVLMSLLMIGKWLWYLYDFIWIRWACHIYK